MQNLGKRRSLAFLGTLLAGIGIGACVTQQAKEGVVGLPASRADASPAYAATGEPIVKAVQKVAPAVVSIDTTARETRYLARDVSDYFSGRGQQITREVPRGAGSGVLLEGGYVLTNEHVVGDAVTTGGRIRVTLPDGQRYNATAVGADKTTDVALLKVQGAQRLPTAPLGQDDPLVPGQTVIAIGNPVGLSASVTSGIVSALGRPIEAGDRVYENLIQTDTAINPGNSGGALVDLGGRVIGINTLVRSDAQNIGFAIPIKTAMRVADELKRHGRIRRPTFGMVVWDLDRFNHSEDIPRGVVVYGLYRNSSAAQAGLMRTDVILRVAGQPTPDEATFRKVLSGLKIGQVVDVVIWRDGEKATVRLPLMEAP